MSAWRRQAITFLPEHKQLAETTDNPMALWIELRHEFDAAMDRKDWKLAGRFLQYAAWCCSPQSGPLPNDTSTAAALAFYEHLPQRRDYWPHFPKWFSKPEFEDLIPVFAYHLEADQLEELKRSYRTKP
jgi:hypothetical protein